jgi:hypothetical protein
LPAEAKVRPHYETDEIVVGLAVAFAIHILIAGPFIYRAIVPAAPQEEEKPLVSKPVVAATLLKLGKPIDPKKLPDRYVPKARTAPQKDPIASREDPSKIHDAGPPPPNAENADLLNLQAKSDPFAEDGGKAKPEEGHAEGIEGGTETDPNKVKAGDMYAAKLGIFLHDRWQYPTVISQGEANRLCVTFQVNLSPRMVVWHVRTEPIKSSGNELFDDSARSMLMKLLDDHTPWPDPPAEVAEMYKGRTVNIALAGDLHGDTSRCR